MYGHGGSRWGRVNRAGPGRSAGRYRPPNRRVLIIPAHMPPGAGSCTCIASTAATRLADLLARWLFPTRHGYAAARAAASARMRNRLSSAESVSMIPVYSSSLIGNMAAPKNPCRRISMLLAATRLRTSFQKG